MQVGNLQILKDQFTEGVLEAFTDKGQAVACISLEKLHEVLKFCREDSRFRMNLLLDVVAVDYPEETPRFEVVYFLYSTELRHRLRLKIRVKEGQELPTASDLFKSADWAEREVYDMMGVRFKDHPNLKRILLFEEFEGHPLRKDYPINKRQPIPQVEKIP